MTGKRLWISWSYHRRSAELAGAFSAAYVSIGDGRTGRLRRYGHCIPRTIAVLLGERPDFLFVQNPSLVLAVLAVILRPLLRYTVVNDLHTPYIRLGGLARRLFWGLQRFCVRRADLTIVTNEGVKKLFDSGEIGILPDKIPSITDSPGRGVEGAHTVLFVCSFAEDEPYEEVRRAAALVGESTHIYVTGRYEKAGWSPGGMPENVHLAGFLPAQEYEELLVSADIVMALTAQPDCLVCGAYEGIAAGKPLILSSQRALREYFSSGATYVDHTAEAIADGIRITIERIDTLRGEIAELRERLDRDWRERFDGIEKLLAGG